MIWAGSGSRLTRALSWLRPATSGPNREFCVPDYQTSVKTKGITSSNAQRSLASNLVGRLEIRMLALALALGAALSILSPHFLTSNNLLNVLDQSVVVGIVAIGMTFVILIGGIDLSVGSVAGLTGVLLGRGLEHFAIPVAIVLAVLAGMTIGLFSGFLIAHFGLPAFVVTLGVMAIARSLAYIFSGATAISDLPEAFGNIVYTTYLRRAGPCFNAAGALCDGLGLSELHQRRTYSVRDRF